MMRVADEYLGGYSHTLLLDDSTLSSFLNQLLQIRLWKHRAELTPYPPVFHLRFLSYYVITNPDLLFAVFKLDFLKHERLLWVVALRERNRPIDLEPLFDAVYVS